MADANDGGSKELSFPKNKIKVLLLEAIHLQALADFEAEGYQVERLTSSLTEDELVERIKGVHIIGIRSKTHITPRVLEAADRLLAIGCFCIGTNQVDLNACELKGIPVFNSPFANSRSVAELMVSHVVALARKIGDRNMAMHRGEWIKSSKGCHEIRGKTIGIIGYGHIGSQLSVMAEAMGMRVMFFDINPIMPIGNAVSCTSMEEVLATADFVTLHVPATERTAGMIGPEEIAMMKEGANLINASRGNVVDLDALAEALHDGRLGGCAVDVYPSEPKANGPGFETPLIGCPNTILTPHVGGATEEAQLAIGMEVSSTLMRFINEGRTSGAVNFPNIDMPEHPGSHRILHVHQNVPGVLRAINNILAEAGNIHAQTLDTTSDIGYLVVDVESSASTEVRVQMADLDTTIRVRVLF